MIHETEQEGSHSSSLTATSQDMEAMQLEISELHHQLRQLNQLPKKANVDNNDDDGEGGSNGKLKNFEKVAMKLGHKYGYKMNLFLQWLEFASQKDINEYNLRYRFGSHLQEGNFWELMGWLPGEWVDSSKRMQKCSPKQ